MWFNATVIVASIALHGYFRVKYPVDENFRNLARRISMFELLKKSILTGIGAVVLTTERVQEATRRLVEEGKMSTDEAEKLADDLLRSGERQWDEVSSRVQDAMRKWAQNMDLVQRKDYLEMRARIEMLEQRIALLEENQRRQSGVAGGY